MKNIQVTLTDLPKDIFSLEKLWCKLKKRPADLLSPFNYLESLAHSQVQIMDPATGYVYT